MNEKTGEKEQLIKRLGDLYNRSAGKCIYTYSGFLYEADASLAFRVAERGDVMLYGGFPEAERVIVRFGNPDVIGYEEPFPVSVIHISPLNSKFSDRLSHRDVLGAVMSLGIEREVVGDILLKDENIWAVVLEKMADHICRELTQIKHTSVKAEPACEVPDDIRPVKQTMTINVASPRIDNVVAGFCGLSRSRAGELFAAGKVFLNGSECHSKDKFLKENDSVTVRGSGKFFYRGIRKETKKKRQVVVIETYGDGSRCYLSPCVTPSTTNDTPVSVRIWR